jgi:hypothetical protein
MNINDASPEFLAAMEEKYEPFNPVKDVVIKTIKEHIPSLTDENDAEIVELAFDGGSGAEDWAIRTCPCGARIDGYYQYVDHLITVFGGESHLGG